jgi:hypothetical protein
MDAGQTGVLRGDLFQEYALEGTTPLEEKLYQITQTGQLDQTYLGEPSRNLKSAADDLKLQPQEIYARVEEQLSKLLTVPP